MKLNKKLLILITALGLVLGIGALAGLAGFYLLGWNFYGVTAFTMFAQIVWRYYYDNYIEYNLLKEGIQQYTSLPFRKYTIPLTCQYCARSADHDIDLNDTVVDCPTCGKKNGLHVSFMTTANPEQ